MNITDFKNSLDYLVKAELTSFVWGRAGIGKSSIVRQYAEKNGYLFFPFYLGTQADMGDILGLAEFVTNPDGSKSTVFAMPQWMKTMIQYCEDNPDSGAVIFLDEFNRARRDILNGMFSFALDKTIHTVKLPKNCYVIAAGNPPTDEYFTTDVNETALMARFVHVKLEPTLDEWVDYSKASGMEPTLIGFVKSQPDFLESKHSEFSLNDIVKPDRRAYERLSKLFMLKTPMNLLEQLMHGIIGLERTVAYMQYLKDQDKPLTALEVLTGKKRKLLQKWSNETDITASCINLTCDNLFEYFKENKDNLIPEYKKNLMEFFNIIPMDSGYNLVTKIVSIPAFRDFSEDLNYSEQILSYCMRDRGKQ